MQLWRVDCLICNIVMSVYQASSNTRRDHISKFTYKFLKEMLKKDKNRYFINFLSLYIFSIIFYKIMRFNKVSCLRKSRTKFQKEVINKSPFSFRPEKSHTRGKILRSLSKSLSAPSLSANHHNRLTLSLSRISISVYIKLWSKHSVSGSV